MQTDNYKKEQLLRLIRDELTSQHQHQQQANINLDDVRLGSGMISKVMNNGLPVYESELKQILLEAMKDNISKIACQVEYEKKLKTINRQSVRKSNSNTLSQIPQVLSSSVFNPPQIQQVHAPQPTVKFDQLSQNIANLFGNLTQMISTQVTNTVQKQLKLNKAQRRKIKDQYSNKPQLPRYKQQKNASSSQPVEPLQQTNQKQKPIVEKVDHKQEQLNDQLFERIVSQTNSKPNVENQVVKQIPQQTRLDTPSFQLEKKPEIHQAISEQDLDDIYEVDFLEESLPPQTLSNVQQVAKNQSTSINQTSISKRPPSQVNVNQSKLSEDLDYPDDFIDESQLNFSQQRSNFFNKKKDTQRQQMLMPYDEKYEQSGKLDFSEDFEDLLL